MDEIYRAEAFFEEQLALGEALADQALELAKADKLPEACAALGQARLAFLAINHLHWLNYLDQQELRWRFQMGELAAVEQLTQQIRRDLLALRDKAGLCRFLAGLAQLYQQIKSDAAALQLYQAALSIAQAERIGVLLPTAHAHLAFQKQLMEQYLDAVTEYDQALHLLGEREEVDAQRYWIFEQLARCFKGLFRNKQAEKFYRLSMEGYEDLGEREIAREVGQELLALYQASGEASKAEALQKKLASL